MVGVIVGVVVGLALVGFVAYIVMRRKKASASHSMYNPFNREWDLDTLRTLDAPSVLSSAQTSVAVSAPRGNAGGAALGINDEAESPGSL